MNQISATILTAIVLTASRPCSGAGLAYAILTPGSIDSLGYNIAIDSFDSSNPLFSTGGQYDVTKQRDHGDIAAIAGLQSSLNVGNVQIMGHLLLGAGGQATIGPNGSVGDQTWVLSGYKGIQPGHLSADVGVVLGNVVVPFVTGFVPASGSVGGTNYTYVLGTGDYIVGNLSGRIYVGGTARLHVRNSLVLSGTDCICIAPGASLELFCGAATASLGGGGVRVASGQASDFRYFGLPSNTTITWSGNTALCGTICAPQAEFVFSGSNDAYDFVGAIAAGSVKLNGHINLHLDESLDRGALAPWLMAGLALQDQTVLEGTTVSFGTWAVGTPNLGYQWQKDGVNLPAQTNLTLTLAAVQATDEGSYRLVVTNAAGALTTRAALLTVLVPVRIEQQPLSQTVPVGTDVSFSVTATGRPSPSYQWLKDGAPLEGQTNAALTLPSVVRADVGIYTVVVSNSVNSVTSDEAVLALSNAALLAVDDPWNKIAPRAQVRQDGVLLIPGTAVLENDSDPDGDPLNVVAVSGQSAEGGTVVLDGDQILYTPRLLDLGQDSFTYTVSDGNGSTGTATVTVHVRNVRWQGGKAHDGYVAGATVFLDTNANRQWDEGEPRGETDPAGNFFVPFIADLYDRNANGVLETSEAQLIIEGGVDIATGWPLVGQLTAPAEATVISPLTHLVTEVLSRSSVSPAEAVSQVLAGLGVEPAVDLLRYDPMSAALTNDAAAAPVFAAAAQVQDTTVQMAALVSTASGAGEVEVAQQVATELARQITMGQQVRLGEATTLGDVLTNVAVHMGASLSADVLAGAVEIMGDGNQAKQTIAATAGSGLEMLLEISRVQGVMQGAVAGALAEVGAGTVVVDDAVAQLAGAALQEQIQSAPVGDVVGTNIQVGEFSFRKEGFRLSEDGGGLDPVTVVRVGGTRGNVEVVVSASDGTATAAGGDYGGPAIRLTFVDGELSKTVPMCLLLQDDDVPEGEETLSVTLALGAGAPAGASLGSRQTALVTLIDNDHPGVFAFGAEDSRVREDGVWLEEVTVVRTGGGAGEVVVVVTPVALKGQAKPGIDYDAAPILVVFLPGNYTRRVSVPVYADQLLEEDEAVQLTLSLAPGAPAQAGLGERTAATLTLVDDPTRRPTVRMESPAIQPEGGLLLHLAGTAGQHFIVQRSTNLRHWNAVASGRLSAEPFPVLDPLPPPAQAFYRVLLTP